MRPYQLDNATYYIPENWDEVKFNQFIDLLAINENESLSEMEKAVHRLAVVTYLPVETIETAAIADIMQAWEYLTFLAEAPRGVETQVVTVDSTNYYPQRIRKVGELAYFEKVSATFQQEPYRGYPYYLAILLRKNTYSEPKANAKSGFFSLFKRKKEANSPVLVPEAMIMDEEELTNRANLFASQLSVGQVMGLAAFFLNKESYSMTISPFFLKLLGVVTKLSENLERTSASNTASYPMCTKWKKTFQSMALSWIQTLAISY
jgi:hypothetical protein